MYISPLKPCNNSYYWSPWRGCKQFSEGCEQCYIRPHNSFSPFYFPFERGEAKSGDWIAVCLSSDFFLEEADGLRKLAWKEIAANPDLMFFITTKRVERIQKCLPEDWRDGWDNVVICVTVENQKWVEYRLPIFAQLPCKHKWITCSPLLEEISIKPFLELVKPETVQCTGERRSGCGKPRPTYFSWVEKLSKDCKDQGVRFSLNYLGDNFILPNGEVKQHWCGWYENDVEDSLQLYNYLPYTYTLDGVEYKY